MKEYKFSPSQIDTFELCERKWAWDRIAKVPRKQHPSAALGERIHGQLERYLLTGEHPRHFHPDGSADETGAMCMPSLLTLPEPGTCVVEGKRFINEKVKNYGLFTFQSPRTGFLYNGRIDWERRFPEEEARALGYEDPENWAEIGDHKSSGNLAYMKTPQGLLKDPQGVIYAVHGMATYQVPHVRLFWNYVPTQIAPRSLPVIQEVHSEGVAVEFERIEGVAERMAKRLDTVGPDDILSEIEPNPDACGAYGGCPYKWKCKLSPLEMMGSILPSTPAQPLKENAMDRLEMMRARLKGATTETTPTPAASAPPAAAATPPAPAAMTAASSPVVASLTIANNPEHVPQQVAAAVAAGQVNPPETSAPVNAVQLSESEAKPAPAAKETKPRAPRTPKSDTVAAPAGPAVPVGTVTRGLGVLFLDCIPMKGFPFVDASTIIAQACAETVAAWNKANPDKPVGDYRGIDYKGGGYVAARAVELVQEIAGGVNMVLNTGTPEGKLLANPLAAIAAVVVKGTVA